MIGGTIVRKLLKKLGRDVVPYDYRYHPVARRMHLLRENKVNLVLDIGANTGQFARELRELGYRGRIVSFEPLKSAYAELALAAKTDARWTTFNWGIGGADGSAQLNVASNAQSSSLRAMLPRHLASAPESAYNGRETITLRTLDSIIDSIATEGENIYLKSDTQGYEVEVLRGAENTLNRVAGLQIELSLVPLYDGETLLADMIHGLAARGFQLMSLEQVFADPATGQLLQVDGIFFRTSPAGSLG